MFNDLLQFLKNPVYLEDENTDFNYRKKIFTQILISALVINIGLTFILSLLEPVFGLDLGRHAIDDALDKYPLFFMVLAAVIFAPILEELFFRGPMIYFKDKPYFKLIFWILTITFGLIHITNYQISTTILLIAPLLILPQIIVGAMLGYIRVKFGLAWAIGLHAIYNFILLGPILLALAFDIPIPSE